MPSSYGAKRRKASPCSPYELFHSLLQLGCRFLPSNLTILGYARSKLSKQDLQDKVRPNLKGDEDMIDEFLDVLDYEAGPYDKPEGYQKVKQPRVLVSAFSAINQGNQIDSCLVQSVTGL